ncbi:hypothetical protein [Streptomyces sp. N35]|uniref:hypothetical protein n=1 Tax=Streptomyces sp. N35 TaxID=2795730 RepID=UPI0018F5701C|nr:hypothetical protein [Streptomyces sp. N35]
MKWPSRDQEVAGVCARSFVEYLSHYVQPSNVGAYFHCASEDHLVGDNNTESEALQVWDHRTMFDQGPGVVIRFPPS